MSREHWGWTIWFGVWLGLGFCLLESSAVWLNAPWPTFSRTLWSLQQRWSWVTVPVVALIAILAAHLVRLKGIAEGDPELVAEVKKHETEEEKKTDV